MLLRMFFVHDVSAWGSGLFRGGGCRITMQPA
jgi:hypothetical protein